MRIITLHLTALNQIPMAMASMTQRRRTSGRIGTSPRYYDTDGDGLKNPWDWDSDGDLIPDGKEINIDPTTDDVMIKTNPLIYTNLNMSDKKEYSAVVVAKTSDLRIEVSVVVDYVGEGERPIINLTETTGLRAVAPENTAVTNEVLVDIQTTEVSKRAEIRYLYDDTELSQDDEKALALYRNDPEKGLVVEEYSGVDTANNIVWARTSNPDGEFEVLDSRNYDSDGDGLSDYDERNIYREVFSDDVEHGNIGWTTGYTAHWQISSGAAQSGTHYWYMSTDIAWMRGISLQSEEFSLPDSQRAFLSFYYKTSGAGSTEASLEVDNFKPDIIYLEPSTTWKEVTMDVDLFSRFERNYWGGGGGNIRSASHTSPTQTFENEQPLSEEQEGGKLSVKFHFFSSDSASVYIDDITLKATTSPRNYDTDGDTLTDGEEVLQYGTNPVNKDTDGDTLSDGYEVNTDWDSATAGVQGTSPVLQDTDGDNWNDGDEVNTYKTNPILSDTDSDGVMDSEDMNPLVDLTLTVNIKEWNQGGVPVDLFDDGDFFVKVAVNYEWKESPPPGEGHNMAHEYPDWAETWNIPDDREDIDVQIQLWDDDGGGSFEQMDITETLTDSTCFLTYDTKTGQWTGDDSVDDSNGYGHTHGLADVWFDITMNDNDGDGMPYLYEIENGLNPVVDDGNSDLDNDGMPNRFEWKYGFEIANPADAEIDSDGDGLLNVWEYELGSRNPRDTRNVYRISLTVSLEWDANATELQWFEDAFKGASLYMMTVTDGYAYISDVTIYNNKQHWDSVNIRVGDQDADEKSDTYWPQAKPNGYWDGVNWYIGKEMRLPRTFQGTSPDTVHYYPGIVHELGHYVFGFHDEYGYYVGWLHEFKEYEIKDLDSLMTSNYFYMSYHGWYDNWFNEHPDYPDTAQWQERGMSCWEWFVQQMGREKVLVDFSIEARNKDYVPYGAIFWEMQTRPDVYINIMFSLSSIGSPWNTTFKTIYSENPPTIDISSSINLVVIS